MNNIYDVNGTLLYLIYCGLKTRHLFTPAKKERFLIQLLTFSVDIPYKRIKPSDKWSPGKDIKDKLSGQNFFI